MSISKCAAIVAATALFWGCNSASSSDDSSGGGASVDSYADLASRTCSSANGTETIFVNSLSANYACVQVSNVWSWQPSVSAYSKLGDCTSALVGTLNYVEQDKKVYVCMQNTWSDVNAISNFMSSANSISSSSNSVVNQNSSNSSSSSMGISSNSSPNISSSGGSETKVSSSSATKVVSFVDGVIWIPSYGKRARTFFNTVDEYSFWSPNSATKDSSGWWKKYNDDEDGGASVTSGSFEADHLLLNVKLNYVNWHKASDGIYTYNAPSPYPYGGFQFSLSTAAGGYSDIRDWGGVCVTYTSTEPFAFAVRSAQTDLGDGMHWEAAMSASAVQKTVEITFANLSRSQYATTFVTRDAALQKATGFEVSYRNDEANVKCPSGYSTSTCNSYGYSASNQIRIYKIAKAGMCGSGSGSIL